MPVAHLRLVKPLQHNSDSGSNSNNGNSSNSSIGTKKLKRIDQHLSYDNILDELEDHYDRYTVTTKDSGTWISLSGITAELQIIIDKIKVRRISGSFATHALLHFLIEWSLEVDLEQNPNIRKLRKVKFYLDKSTHLGTLAERTVYQMFSQYVTIPMEGGKRQTVVVDETIRERLNAISKLIGVDATRLGLLLVLRAICMIDHLDHNILCRFQDKYQELLDLIQIRCKTIIAAAETLGIELEEED